MELFKCLFGVVTVVVLACDVAAQQQWMVPSQKHHAHHPSQLPQQQSNVFPPAAPSDKCQVEEGEKIQCGIRDVNAEECGNLNCCFDGRQCYYGKAGMCALE